MRTEQLQYLVTLARCGSMNKASRELFITQPALSAAISSLEKEIGIVLVKRNKQGIALTAAGQQVCDDAVRILDNIHSWSHLSKVDETLADTITVSTFETVGYLILPSVVSRLSEDYPNLQVAMEHYIFDPAQFFDDRFDVIITPSVEEALPENARYQQECIFQDYYVAFLSTRSPLAEQNTVTMSELTTRPFAFTPESRFLPFIPTALRETAQFLWLEQKESIMANVAMDNAVTIFPSMRGYNNYYVETGQIVARPLADKAVHYDHILIYPSNDRLSPAQKIFLKYLRQAYADFYTSTIAERQALLAPAYQAVR